MKNNDLTLCRDPLSNVYNCFRTDHKYIWLKRIFQVFLTILLDADGDFKMWSSSFCQMSYLNHLKALSFSISNLDFSRKFHIWILCAYSQMLKLYIEEEIKSNDNFSWELDYFTYKSRYALKNKVISRWNNFVSFVNNSEE